MKTAYILLSNVKRKTGEMAGASLKTIYVFQKRTLVSGSMETNVFICKK